jgi:hypothetical protein
MRRASVLLYIYDNNLTQRHLKGDLRLTKMRLPICMPGIVHSHIWEYDFDQCGRHGLHPSEALDGGRGSAMGSALRGYGHGVGQGRSR